MRDAELAAGRSFKSKRAHQFAGEWLSVVTEPEVVTEFGKWVQNEYLKFSGTDVDSPKHRIQKMWGKFIGQIEKEPKLRKLFANVHGIPTVRSFTPSASVRRRSKF